MGLICRFKNGLFCLYIAHIRPSTVNLVAVHRLISAHLHIIAFALGEVLAGIAGFLLPGHVGLGHHLLKVLVLGPTFFQVALILWPLLVARRPVKLGVAGLV